MMVALFSEHINAHDVLLAGGRIHTASHTGTTVALMVNHQELLHLEEMTLAAARIYRRATYFHGYKISRIGGQIFEDEQVMSY